MKEQRQKCVQTKLHSFFKPASFTFQKQVQLLSLLLINKCTSCVFVLAIKLRIFDGIFFLFILVFCKLIHRYLSAKSALPLSSKFPFLGVVSVFVF